VKKKKLYITPRQLHGHVRWLQSLGYRFTTLTAALHTPEPVACITFDDGFRDIAAALEVPATVFAVTSRVGERGVVFEGDEGVAPSDLLTWDELKALRDLGWEIGSHSHRHARRPPYEDLAESAETLERRLGVRPTALAYPYGAYDEATLEAARRAGFRCAATTKSGLADREAPFTLRRVILSGFGALTAFERLKLLGVHRGLYPFRPRPL
jgi:peptidoglycan/xylan/chitin deacetylase (PgdA/CDA1 family)